MECAEVFVMNVLRLFPEDIEGRKLVKIAATLAYVIQTYFLNVAL